MHQRFKRCIDPFHVVQWATEALDEVRRLAWRDALKNSADKTTKERGRPKKGAPKKDTTAKDLKGSGASHQETAGSA